MAAFFAGGWVERWFLGIIEVFDGGRSGPDWIGFEVCGCWWCVWMRISRSCDLVVVFLVVVDIVCKEVEFGCTGVVVEEGSEVFLC